MITTNPSRRVDHFRAYSPCHSRRFGILISGTKAVEYIATFDFEIKYMWPMKLNLVTILFFYTRYSPIVDMTVTLYSTSRIPFLFLNLALLRVLIAEHATNMTQPLCSVLARTYVCQYPLPGCLSILFNIGFQG